VPIWLRNLVMIVGLGVWVAVIAAYLLQDKLPDALLLGVPAALVIALAPPSIGGRGGRSGNQPDPPPGQPDAEGTTP
jgi:hypothetical protein